MTEQQGFKQSKMYKGRTRPFTGFTNRCRVDLLLSACSTERHCSRYNTQNSIRITFSTSCEHSGERILKILVKSCLAIGPHQANLVLIAYASSEGSGEPAHQRSLARTSAARSYRQ